MRLNVYPLIILFSIFNLSEVLSQGVGIGTESFTPAEGALLELRSTSSGFLMPRMTRDQRDEITTPTEGLVIYQTDGIAGFYYYNGFEWAAMGGDDLGNHNAVSRVVMNDNIIANVPGGDGIRISDAGNVAIGPSAEPPAQRLQVSGGNVAITSSGGNSYGLRLQNPAATFNTTLKAGAQTADITYTLPTSAPTNGQVLNSDASGNMGWTSVSAMLGSVTTAVNGNGTDQTVSSTSYGDVNQMSLAAMPAGTYIVQFNAEVSTSNSNTSGQFIINAGGSTVAESQRNIQPGSTSGIMSIMTVVTMGSPGAISIQTKKTGSGNVIVGGRTMMVIRIG